MKNLKFESEEKRNDFFNELNSILKKYELNDMVITGVKMEVDPTSLEMVCIPPKKKFCYMDNQGKIYCRCI